MAKKVITVCDNCGSEGGVTKRRVGDATHLYTLDLCDNCGEAVDRLVELGRSIQPRRVSMKASTPQEIRRARRAAQKRPD